jgi:hypothetical protein
MNHESSRPASDRTSSPPAEVPLVPTSIDADNSATHLPSAGNTNPADSYPYWIPPGLDIEGWPPHIRAHVAAVINPEYEELVLKAKPGVGRQMALSLLHLGWLEILDHLRLGQLVPPPRSSDPLEELRLDSRQQVIARHLRLVNAKLRIAQFLFRLDEFKKTCQPQHEGNLPNDDQLLCEDRSVEPNGLLRYAIENGKDDVY